ncbi:MAG: hypothetical protein JSR96_10360 [Proteobacteria bacterium]|nr:hypothetical protein [Pseudomonadota bacterium]
MRRSILYFDELRFDMALRVLQFACMADVPRFWSGTAPPGLLPDAIKASPECLINCEGARLAGTCNQVKVGGGAVLRNGVMDLALSIVRSLQR